jgi:hypothetical protein
MPETPLLLDYRVWRRNARGLSQNHCRNTRQQWFALANPVSHAITPTDCSVEISRRATRATKEDPFTVVLCI